MEYGYNLMGNMTFQKYPSGKIVSVDYDNDGRVAGIRNGTQYYAGGDALSPNRITYTAQGAITTLRFGNGLWEHSISTRDSNRLKSGSGARAQIQRCTSQSTPTEFSIRRLILSTPLRTTATSTVKL